MGKSCVIKKLQAEKPAGVLTFVRDVENVATPLEFVERIYHDVEEHLSRRQKTAGRTRRLLQEVAGTEIAGLIKLPTAAAPHWKSLLEKLIEDVTENQDRTVVLFWDEFPWMLQKIKKTSGEAVVMDVLDSLRCLRQTYESLRMVYTGSIGLHHVTSALVEAGHTHGPLNDMRIVEVPSLSEPDARSLAAELLRGEGLRSEDLDETAGCIATEVDCIPYYIHSVVATLKDWGEVVDTGRIKQFVSEALVDPQDRWNLQHYQDRLPEYYGADRVPVVLSLLDQLAAASGPLTFDELLSSLSIHVSIDEGEAARQILTGDSELLRQVLMLLQRDHYIQQSSDDGAYTFRFPLIKRWWRLHRNLTT
ncbi:MAG: ATP-binding protein [Planctomycetota bacterium]|nr:ATP-binding protein [Planctomycetota bacterium]